MNGLHDPVNEVNTRNIELQNGFNDINVLRNGGNLKSNGQINSLATGTSEGSVQNNLQETSSYHPDGLDNRLHNRPVNEDYEDKRITNNNNVFVTHGRNKIGTIEDSHADGRQMNEVEHVSVGVINLKQEEAVLENGLLILNKENEQPSASKRIDNSSEVAVDIAKEYSVQINSDATQSGRADSAMQLNDHPDINGNNSPYGDEDNDSITQAELLEQDTKRVDEMFAFINDTSDINSNKDVSFETTDDAVSLTGPQHSDNYRSRASVDGNGQGVDGFVSVNDVTYRSNAADVEENTTEPSYRQVGTSRTERYLELLNSWYLSYTPETCSLAPVVSRSQANLQGAEKVLGLL